MMRILRMLRGTLGMALTWAVAWAVAGAVLGAVIMSMRIAPGTNFPLLEAESLRAATIFGIIGFLNGIAFAIALAASERRRSFNDLSASRIALWGLVGGISYPAVFSLSRFLAGVPIPNDLVLAIPICALFGAASAWSILRIARGAKEGERGQLGPGAARDFMAPSRERDAVGAK